MAIEKRKCGCRSDGHQWIQLCPTHFEEYRLAHEQALAEHRAMNDYHSPDVDPILR